MKAVGEENQNSFDHQLMLNESAFKKQNKQFLGMYQPLQANMIKYIDMYLKNKGQNKHVHYC